MAATDLHRAPTSSALCALLGAAASLLALPNAQAGQLEEARFGVNYLSYREKDGRMSANAPQAWLQAPLARDVDLEARVTVDSLAGASPQAVSNPSGTPVHTLSSASIRELRREGLVRATRWLGDDTIAVGARVSSEHDYLSQALDVSGKFNFLNQNLTLTAGLTASSDSIGATGQPDLREHRSTRELFLGLTQVLGPDDIMQVNLARSAGVGYYNDPYKYTLTYGTRIPVLHPDSRPDNRQSTALLGRWRHFLPWKRGGALGLDYRYYADSWNIHAHTVDASWHQNLDDTWAIRPSFRWYTQSAASFYAPTFNSRTGLGSSDERLAAFGARTLALSLIARGSERDTLEAGIGRYAQRAHWRPGGGSANIADFDASFLQLAWTRSF